MVINMSNMLRGKFRDKIRNFLINRNKKQSIESIKEIKKQKNNINLNSKNNEPNRNVNIQVQKKTTKDTYKKVENKSLKKGINIKVKSEKKINPKVGINVKNDGKIEILENKISGKVENIINDYKNKLEIISTDIYVLNKYIDDNKTKEKCTEEQKEIKNIIERIDKIKEQYKILKSKNIELEYLDIDDSLLIDDIYNYKKLISNVNDISKYQDKYKKLEVFIETNSLLENIESSIKKLENSNKEKMNKINIDEEKFNEIKNGLFKYDNEFNRFNNFIDTQNSIIEEMSSKVGKINSYEEINTKLVGFDKLLFNNLKYVSLLLLSPLKGLFPVIATSTLATKSTIDLLKKQVHIEESKKIIYTAEDYEQKINTNIYSVTDMIELISLSMNDIKDIKEKLKQNKSLNDTPEYKNVMEKIENIELILKNNKNKLNSIQNKLNTYKKTNNDKLVKVRKLNES